MKRCARSVGTRRVYYVLETSRASRSRYYCCSGWRSGLYKDCSIPICRSGCVHGNCTSPNTCTCNSGWTGSRCNIDVNECKSSIHGCQQECINTVGSFICNCNNGYIKSSTKTCRDQDECTRSPCTCASRQLSVDVCNATCINSPGSYQCSCSKGFKTMTARRTICEDVNECSGYNNKCGKTQQCVNTLGSYYCVCPHGYKLKTNQSFCEDVNECKTNNGECEHNCTNTPGSRRCTCRRGYRLDSDDRSCSEINECREGIHRCQYGCRNTRGSFTCYCGPGYELNSDKRTCSDINECRRYKGRYVPLSTCQQLCTNTDGSYTCGCRRGFKILEDRRSCGDVDECKTWSHGCGQECINTLGSYNCSCKAGYELNSDERSCRALPCEIIKKPLYASLNCSGTTTSHFCWVSCYHGYNREGPQRVTCMPNQRWSVPQPTCRPKLCGILSPRPNAIVSLPCYRHFRSSCDMRCISGYYSSGSSKATCDLTADQQNVVWKTDFECFYVRNCKPNPCRHGGIRTSLSSKDFQCDCSNTGYEGRLCEHGVIDIPLFPKLKANLPSPYLSLQAKPSKEIKVSIVSDDDVVAEPNELPITGSSTNAYFTLKAQRPGFKSISYYIQGENEEDYQKPADSILFVTPELKPETKSIFAENPTLEDELPIGCYMTVLDNDKCSAKLSSTLPWSQYTNQEQVSTQGIVHLTTKEGISTPLSLIGYDFPLSSDSILNKVKQFHHGKLNNNAKLNTSAANICKSTKIGLPGILELVENDVFATTFFKVFSKFTPSWMKISSKDETSVFDIKNIHALINSESNACSSLFDSSNVITYEPNIGSIFTFDEDITLPDERGFCYAIDVCTSDVGFALPSESTKAIKSSALFQDMRNAGWDIGLTGAIFPRNGKATVTIGQSLWNGRQLENLKLHEYKVLLKGRINIKLGNKENTTISLAYQGDIFINTENLEKSFHYGFERETTSVLKGKAAMNLTTTVFDKQVTIHLPQREVVGKSLLGGANKPRNSYNHGWFIVWKRVSNLLQGTPFNHVVHPKRNQPVFVTLENKIQGGRQREITNLKEYNIITTLLRLLIPQMKSLLKNPKLILLLKTETLDKWAADINHAETLSRDIRSAMSGDLSTSLSLNKFSSLITKLRNRIRNVKSICRVIESEVKSRSFGDVPLIVNQAKNLKDDIPKIPSVRWKRSAMIVNFRKFSLLFKGKMCSKKTCFDDVKIILESTSPKILDINVDHHQEKYNLSFVVEGKLTQPLTLGSVAALEKDDRVFLEIYNDTKASRLSFNPKVNLLGIQKVVTAVVKHDILSFQTSGLMFGKHQASINVSAKTEYHDWSLIQYRLQGRMDLNSRLLQSLQKKINNHAREVAKKATLRIKNAESEAKKNNDNLRNFTELLRQKFITYEDLKQKNGSQFALLNANRMSYKMLKDEIYSGLSEDDEERARQRCPLMECGKICSMINVCSYERKKRNITYDEPNCLAKEKTIEREKILQESANTFYVKPTFVTQYTGNCGSGGFFTTIADAITGCDRTYAAVRGEDEKVPYTRVWLSRVTEKIPVKVFDCSNPVSKIKVVDSYEFSCEKTKCVKVMNSTCFAKKLESCKIYNNQNSEKPLSQYEKFKNEQFKNLSRLAILRDIAYINLKKTQAKLDKSKKELDITRAQKKQLENAKNELDSAVTEIKSIPDVILGLRVSRILEKHRDKKILLSVADLTFDETITDDQANLKNQMPMTMTVKPIDGKQRKLSVVFDFDKEDISIHRVIKQVIRGLYEKKRDATRRKRSIPDNFLNKFITTAENQVDIQNVWNNHRRCLKSRNAYLFYTDVFKSLDQLIHVRKQAEQSNKDNVNKLVSLYKTFEKITTVKAKEQGNDHSKTVLKSYLEYFTLLINEKQNFTKSWEDVLVIWKTFLEGLTKERSFSECAGFQDCLVSIAEDLNDLYLYESDYFRANEIRGNISYVKDSIVDLISRDFTLNDFKTKVLDLKSHLHHTEDTNVLCGRKPEITLVLSRSKVVVENEIVTLFCNATSDTKVTYQWIHNNESLIQSDNGLLTIRKVNISHAGSYKCKAINRKGFATSNVTIISVKSKPKITEHPNDTNVYAKDGKGFLLVCNATGDPEPDIEWFFISQYPNSSEVKIYNDNGAFLYYENPTTNFSGYYYCIARNTYGRAESKRARVWVLDMSPGQPRIEVKMNITKACNKQNISLDCSKYRRGNIHQTLASLLNCSLSQIENTSYVSDGYGNSTVSFLYISYKPIIEKIDRDHSIEPVFETLLDSFARKRKQLVEELQLLYHRMKNETTSLEEEIIDPESLLVRGAPPGCPRKQEPHSNGFMCVNCPPGSYRSSNGRCMSCPLQTYQYKQGQTECMHCEDGSQTETLGTISPKECFKILPDAAPVITHCIPLSYDSARITWSPIPENKRNGIIRGYKIYFKAGVGEKWQKWQVQTTKSVSVTSYDITGLKPSTWYCFKMSAFTSKGEYRFWKESECWMIKTPSGSKG